MEKSTSAKTLSISQRQYIRKPIGQTVHRKHRVSDVSLKHMRPSQLLNSSARTTKQAASRGGLRLSSSRNILNISSRKSFQIPSMGSKPQSSIKAKQFPLKPNQCLQYYRLQLTEYEQTQIFQYQDILFIGRFLSKIHPRSPQNNFGYDDQQTDYKLQKGDHIAYRYQIGAILGKGSFGQVCQCFDHKRKEQVAVKIIKNKRRFHKQAAVEIKILQKFKDTEFQDCNVVKMKNYFMFRKHVCIVFELLTINLYEFLKKNKFEGLSIPLIKRFAQQILTCLKYCRAMQVIHCDLKPENIMLQSATKSNIKMIDFGSACFLKERVYTYIQSRFYRAPEIMLGVPYTMAIDMWSLGCILVELYISFPIFPGESEQDQFSRIMEVKGLPPACLLERATRKSLFFSGDQPKIVVNRRGQRRIPGQRPLETVLKCPDYLFVDLIEKCFEWDPQERITPVQALKHPWFNERLQRQKTRLSQSQSQSQTHLT